MLQVGIATTSITPRQAIYLNGYGPDRLSEGVYKDITATAVVFANGRTRVGLMALDVLSVDDFLLVPVRQAAAALGIPPAQMLLNTSHTHTGPVVERVRSPVRRFDEAYLDWLRQRLCELVGEAVADLQPATLDYSVGLSAMGVNRRRPNEPRLLPSPAMPIDLDVPVLRVLSPSGAVRAVLFSYACHSANTGMPRIGTDWPGYARDEVAEAIPGCVPVFLQGCGGDVKSRLVDPLRGTFSKRLGLAGIAEAGREVGRAACVALCGTPLPLGDRLGGASEIVHLAFDHQPTAAELDAPEINATWRAAARREIAAKGGLIPALPVEIQALRLGELLIVAAAAETCVELGLRIKQELAGRPVCTLGYSNCSWDYIAPEQARLDRNYEGVACHADTVYPWPKPLGFRPDAPELFIARSVALARSL
jgi:hypothetical protein